MSEETKPVEEGAEAKPAQVPIEPKEDAKEEGKPDDVKEGAAATQQPPAEKEKEKEKAKPKRGGSKPILKTSGIGRVDNQLKQTLFQPPVPINQKNYYTEYLKKDDQILFYRDLAEEQKRQKELKKQKEEQKKDETKREEGEEEEEQVPEAVGSKTIVLHPGSQNIRIGLATQAYPKSVPNVIAHRVRQQQGPEATDGSNDDSGEAMDVDTAEEVDEEFDTAHKLVRNDLSTRMKFYKRRIVPNSHGTVSSYNSRQQYEEIPDHNDPYRVEWTEIDRKSPKNYYTGLKATRIAPDSQPRYELKWPIRYGMFNEKDYDTPQQVLGDISLILMDGLQESLSISFKDYKDYNVILLIPDLYDKSYVSSMVGLILEMGFANVAILQEAMGATFGAGISAATIIDVGAEKCSISCVEEGMVIPDSRVNLRFGGNDITTSFVKMLKKSNFPYDTIDLTRQYDWDLANELKQKFCTANDADIAVQLYNFYQRSPHRPTRKYQFKTFDEPMLSALGLFYPQLFQLNNKITSRYNLFPRSIDIYEQGFQPNDPISDAQINLFQGTLASEGKAYNKSVVVTQPPPEDEQPASSSTAATGEEEKEKEKEKDSDVPTQAQAFAQVDQTVVPCIGLEHAIIESITNATLKAQGSKASTFYENLMIVGGGAAKLSGFNGLLTDRISMYAQRENEGPADPYTGEIAVMPIPREMDPELITWKGGGVYAKLKIVNEVWISAREWDLFGPRCLQYKVLFLY